MVDAVAMPAVRIECRDPESAWVVQMEQERTERREALEAITQRDAELLRSICARWTCEARDVIATVTRLLSKPDRVLSDRDLVFLVEYGARHRSARRRNVRALALFRSLLTPTDRREYDRSGHVTFAGSAGGTYRTRPSMGVTWSMARRGLVMRHIATYCYHDPDRVLPPADVSAAHLLILRSDEPGFLAEANARLLRATA